MTPIRDSDVPASLDEVAARVRHSSNFRFAWRWFDLGVATSGLPTDAELVMSTLIATPTCHAFLRDSFNPMYDPTFTIEPVHEHAQFREATLEFEKTLARAAADRLGAYSRHLTDAEPADVGMVRRSFSSAAPYTAFVLEPGRATGCSVCKAHNGYLFTSWFYGVAWDWCFCLLSRARPLAWVGVLTDTD
jgi:hypothetical protein